MCLCMLRCGRKASSIHTVDDGGGISHGGTEFRDVRRTGDIRGRFGDGNDDDDAAAAGDDGCGCDDGGRDDACDGAGRHDDGDGDGGVGGVSVDDHSRLSGTNAQRVSPCRLNHTTRDDVPPRLPPEMILVILRHIRQRDTEANTLIPLIAVQQ